jgi:hypothetical protein
MKYCGRERILDFFNEVLCAKPTDVEVKKQIFVQYKKNSENEDLKNQWIRCNSRFLFNTIMAVTRNTLSFEYLKYKRQNIVLEDFEFLIFQGQAYLLWYSEFYEEYSDIQMYEYLRDVIKKMIGHLYNSIEIYFHHNLKASYTYQDSAIYWKNEDSFDWENVYIEAWCIDLKQRLSSPTLYGHPAAPYPVCIDISRMGSQETLQLPIDRKVTGDILTNELAAICLWCKKPKGIGFYKVLNNFFLKERDASKNIPVFIKDFDRHIGGSPSPFP